MKPKIRKSEFPDGGRGIELAGLGPRQCHEVADGVDMELFRHRYRQHGDIDADDGHDVARIESWRAFVVEMNQKGAGRPEEQRVIVMGIDEGLDGDQPVAAGPVLDHHRLAPARAQPVGE